jgi:hypothetical protein
MRSSLAALLLGTLLLTIPACVVVDPGGPPSRSHGGPPPHAPAHGYRHKHHGHDLVFDTELGVYVVVGLRDVWFLDGSYFRLSGENWEIGLDVGGPWQVAAVGAVPGRLREKRHPHGGPPGQQKKKYKH